MIYILLDIDGTLLPAYTDDRTRPTLTIQLSIADNALPLTFYTDIIQEFRKISHLPNVKIVMCTSWDETSLDIARELGIKV